MLLGITVTASAVCVLALLVAVLVSVGGGGKSAEKEIKKEKILDYLPGDNCGACGCKTCADLAEKIAEGKCSPSSCLSGGAPVAQAVGVVVGREDESTEPVRAQVMCSCTDSTAAKKYRFDTDGGEPDCLSAMHLGGGERECRFACIGMGSCQKSCPYGAISIVNGTASVDYRRCTGCGICTDVCPKNLIKMIPYDTYYWVGCSSKDRAAKTANKCKVGCSGCGECVKACPEGAVTVKDNVAVIDYTVCTGCGACFRVCPEGIIWKADAVGASDLVFSKGK